MSALALAVLLSLVSAVAYAGGAIVQERVAASSPATAYAPVRRPAWWTAVGLNGLGAALHVAALAFGPLSLVQPLGALTIVFALPMAALFVGRGAGPAAWRGAVMATVGLAGLLSLAGSAGSDSLAAPERSLLALVTFGTVGTLMLAAHGAHRHPVLRSVLLATASGISFGIASVFTKTVAVDLAGGAGLSGAGSLLVIAVLATGGLLLSQAAYRGAGLAAPLAVVTVVNPVVAATVGLTLFGETFRYGTAGTVVALAFGVVAAGGLVLLTTERIGRAEREAQQQPLTAPGTASIAEATLPVVPDDPAALDGLHDLGRVRKVSPAPRRLARTLAAPDEDPSSSATRACARHAESTHQTPQGPPSGRTTTLSGHDLAPDEVRRLDGIPDQPPETHENDGRLGHRVGS